MRIFLALVFVITSIKCSTQNLLVNGNFEEENICTEYKINCAPEAWIYTVPSFIYYFKDKNLAHSGSRFVGLIAGHSKKSFYRTFVRSRLLCGLRKGNIYHIEFFIKSQHPILDSVGVYFTSYDFLFEKNPYPQIVPSLFIADAEEKAVKGDTAWQKISIKYTAKGDEAFITLGFFNRNGLTGETGISMENYFFFFLDDISLLPVDPNEKLCVDWKQARDEIYEQNERHEYLAREIKSGKNNPIEKVALSFTVLHRIDTLILPDLLFSSGNSLLQSSSFKLLDSLCNRITNARVDSLVIEGHTDSTGLEEFNEHLSNNRAASVRNYIIQRIKGQNLPVVTRGYSSTKPIAGNSTASGRQRNRRVEILVYIRE